MIATRIFILENSAVQLLFQGSDYSDYLTFYGRATISQDKAIIKELWEPIIKTWFTDGVDDERITVLRVEPVEAYYWDTKHGEMVAFAKQLIGAALGKTTDDSIEGKLILTRKTKKEGLGSVLLIKF